MIVCDDDERHEVAERLREDASCSESSPREVVESYLGIEYDGEDVLEESYTRESLLHIADLIDPTCKILDAHWDDGQCTWGCICSSCDAHLEYEKSEYLRYCPECGRRNVNAN